MSNLVEINDKLKSILKFEREPVGIKFLKA